MWNQTATANGVGFLEKLQQRCRSTDSGVSHLLKIAANVPQQKIRLRQQASERKQRLRDAALNNSRKMAEESDVTAELQLSTQIVDVDMSAATHEYFQEAGDPGGVVCPVCCSQWYSIREASGGCQLLCDLCQVRLPLETSLRQLRRHLNQVLDDHSAECQSRPTFSHVSDPSALYNYTVVCVCMHCSYFNVVI